MSAEKQSKAIAHNIADEIFLSLYTLQWTYIMLKLKFKMDPAAIITMTIYLLAFISKVVGDHMFEKYTKERQLSVIILHCLCNLLISVS
jgi:hypothetical protein